MGLFDCLFDFGFLCLFVWYLDIEVWVLWCESLIVVLFEAHLFVGWVSVRLVDLRDEFFITYFLYYWLVVYEIVFDACQRVGFMFVLMQEVGETSTLVLFVVVGFGVVLVLSLV